MKGLLKIADLRLKICYSHSSIFNLKSSILFTVLLIVLFPSPSPARPIIADTSIRKIEIDSGFTGTDVLLFGARSDPGDIVVVIRGPEKSYTIRKKERVLGIWVNKKQITLNNINGFNVIAASRKLPDINNDALLDALRISTGQNSLPEIENIKPKHAEFYDAFIAKMQKDNLYFPEVKEVSFIGDTLFRTIIRFPENIIRGTYTAEIYLFSDGQLSGIQSTPIIVSSKGFDAFMYDFAHKYSVLYGILAVAIALFAGWVAGHVFRKV